MRGKGLLKRLKQKARSWKENGYTFRPFARKRHREKRPPPELSKAAAPA